MYENENLLYIVPLDISPVGLNEITQNVFGAGVASIEIRIT
jgi:hypothetical protein